MEIHEKRRYIRHLLVSPLEFEVENQDGSSEKTQTVNVSEGGLMFVTSHEVQAGAVIKLSLPLYDKVFKINARVVHTEKNVETGLLNVGVAFLTYSDAFRVKLVEQIYLIEEYRGLRSLQLGREMSLQEASREWIKRYSEKFEKLYW